MMEERQHSILWQAAGTNARGRKVRGSPEKAGRPVSVKGTVREMVIKFEYIRFRTDK